MNQGDLIDWNGERWLVQKTERATKSSILINIRGVREVIPQTLDETAPDTCKVIGNPTTEWPFVILQMTNRHGRMGDVFLPEGETRRCLIPFYDWIRIDPLQIGGALFLNPALGIGNGHILLIKCQRGELNIRIPKSFGSTNQRMERAAAEAMAAPRTVYDRLLGDDFDEDD